jgi:virulence-associated protein VapD
MDLAKANPWFALSVKDIRMLRIEDNNDLMPAVQKAAA